MLEGVVRHITVWREAWKIERRRDKKKRQISEKEFLPAAIEILETPASPLGRATMWLMVVFFTIAVLWSIIGRIDMVATGQGKVIPRERVKTVQPALGVGETGVVRAIHVGNGQRVVRGEVMIELDRTFAGADEAQAKTALLAAEVAEARGRALLGYMQNGRVDFRPPEQAPDNVVLMQERLIDSRIREYEASLAALRQQRQERRADLSVVDRELTKLTDILPLIEEQVAAREELTEKGLSPRLLLLELRERHVAHVKNIEIQRDQKVKVEAAIATVDRHLDQLAEEFRKNTIEELAAAEDEAAIRREELKKAEKRNVLQNLKAPIDGTVQQLAVHTVGGVVEPAQPLMIIVPNNSELVVEAKILNKDIGFIAEGDTVEVKLETFPFTKYGVIHGELENLSRDAVEDEKLGLIYIARIALEQEFIMVQGREVRLSPGMAATAEVKTGTRRLIEFLMSPLLRYKDEALRER